MKKKFKSALLNNAVAFPTICARQMYRRVRPGAAAAREREKAKGDLMYGGGMTIQKRRRRKQIV